MAIKVVEPNYYMLLGISRQATLLEIKKAYRGMASKYHPDHNIGNEDWANNNIKRINEAYEVLSNPEKKAIYDNKQDFENQNAIHINPHPPVHYNSSKTKTSNSDEYIRIFIAKDTPPLVRLFAGFCLVADTYMKAKFQSYNKS
jgi:curved DNA-binding protein